MWTTVCPFVVIIGKEKKCIYQWCGIIIIPFTQEVCIQLRQKGSTLLWFSKVCNFWIKPYVSMKFLEGVCLTLLLYFHKDIPMVSCVRNESDEIFLYDLLHDYVNVYDWWKVGTM